MICFVIDTSTSLQQKAAGLFSFLFLCLCVFPLLLPALRLALSEFCIIWFGTHPIMLGHTPTAVGRIFLTPVIALPFTFLCSSITRIFIRTTFVTILIEIQKDSVAVLADKIVSV